MTDTNSIEVEHQQSGQWQNNAGPTLAGINQVPDKHAASGTPPAVSLEEPSWKRSLDLALIILALPILLPLMVFIAILIWAVSGGPVMFRQERVGFLGKRFICFKFRTMFVGNDGTAHQRHLAQLMSSNQPMVKMDKGDSRIIPFGRLLRLSGFDELPQIINVIRGEMSLVGPRPCIPYEYENYRAWQKERFNAVPGLTGLWQVCGKNKTTFEQMIHLDIQYAKNPTLTGDLAILLKTMPMLAGQLMEARSHRPSRRTGESLIQGVMTKSTPLSTPPVV